MVNKYVSAIGIGIITALVAGLISSMWCCLPISFILLIAAGVVTVFLASSEIVDTKDAVILSGIAGGLAGLLGGIIASLGFTFLVAILKNAEPGEFELPVLLYSGFYGIFCIPVMLIAGIILAAIGGLAYAKLVLKK